MSLEFGIGKELRAARLGAELKITDVAEELNLKVEHLTAIEKDQYGDLPGTTYVIGFVRSYAKFLGLNDAHLIDRLLQSGLVEPLEGAAVKPVIEKEKISSSLELEPKSRKKLFVGILFAIFVAGLVYAFLTSSNQSVEGDVFIEDDAENAEVTYVNPSVETAETEATPAPKAEVNTASAVVETVSQTPVREIKLLGTKPEGARVLLTALEDAWYQVYHPTTKVVYQNAVLKAGQSVWLEDVDGVLMDIGRPHKMALTIDGKDYGVAGPSWGGVIKRLPTNANYLIHDYYGAGVNEKSYHRWLRDQGKE